MDADFDAIVVGAGPAGSVAAYSLAVAGLNVLMIERGTAPGSKNVTGGRLYAHALERVIPGFAGEAPLERLVTRETITFLTDESAVSVDVASDKLLKTPSYTVLRAEFDAWLAARAEAAGATLVTSIRADEPILEGGKVVGVRCGEDSMGASVVIAADGANSLIARKAGLRRELDPSEMATGVKCVLELPRGVIEERFNLDEGGGAAHLYVGECTKGMPGGGFLYTNKESLSIGLVVQAAAVARSPHRLVDLVEDFRLHPRLGALVKDGRLVEYSAHLIPEAGLAGMASPVADGLLVVGDAAGLVLNTGYTLRGMDFAMASGAAAAEAVIEAAVVRGLDVRAESSLDHLELVAEEALSGLVLTGSIQWLHPNQRQRLLTLATTRLALEGVLVLQSATPESWLAATDHTVSDLAPGRPLHAA